MAPQRYQKNAYYHSLFKNDVSSYDGNVTIKMVVPEIMKILLLRNVTKVPKQIGKYVEILELKKHLIK